MTENPFRSPDNESKNASPIATTGSILGIVNHALRFCFGSIVLVLIPVFATPIAKNMFEEFGIELPVITRSLIAWSDWMNSSLIIMAPAAVFALLAVESGLFFIPKPSWKTTLGILFWLLLILIAIIQIVAIWSPAGAIISGM